MGLDTYTWGIKDFHKCWSGTLAKRRLCLGPAGVISCTPLSAPSFWVSWFPGMHGYTSCAVKINACFCCFHLLTFLTLPNNFFFVKILSIIQVLTHKPLLSWRILWQISNNQFRLAHNLPKVHGLQPEKLIFHILCSLLVSYNSALCHLDDKTAYIWDPTGLLGKL